MATAPAAARRRGNTDFIGIPSWFPDAEVEETRLGRPFGQQEMNDGRRSTEIRALFSLNWWRPGLPVGRRKAGPRIGRGPRCRLPRDIPVRLIAGVVYGSYILTP